MIGQRLILSNIAKRYGEAWAVREADLEIEPGEFVSIVGPSGSGKTSLLTMVAGFETPTAGIIRIGEKNVTALPPNRREIGMVFQKYALFPHMTVRQNVAFPLRMRRVGPKSASRTRVDEMLELVRLSGYAHRYPHELSGGQQQRVAVARALVFDPPLILMDEPLGALDKKLREAMQFEIKRIQERLGATVLYVTHDQDEALTMSDRVAVMLDGRLQQLGTPVELYRRPQSSFVADFIGRMNFIEGSLAGSQSDNVLVRISDSIVLPAPWTAREDAAIPHNGTSVQLAIRPERVSLARRGCGGSHALAGTVETAVFIGPFHLFLVRLDARPDIVFQAQIPAGDAPSFERHDAVDLLLDHEGILIFPAEEKQAA